MRTELARIGNSRGIRIPKPLIAQCGLGDVVELRVTAEGLVIAPHRSPRQGWHEAFAASSERGKSRQIALDQLRAIDRQRLVRKLGTIPAKTGQQVSSVLVEMLVR